MLCVTGCEKMWLKHIRNEICYIAGNICSITYALSFHTAIYGQVHCETTTAKYRTRRLLRGVNGADWVCHCSQKSPSLCNGYVLWSGTHGATALEKLMG